METLGDSREPHAPCDGVPWEPEKLKGGKPWEPRELKGPWDRSSWEPRARWGVGGRREREKERERDADRQRHRTKQKDRNCMLLFIPSNRCSIPDLGLEMLMGFCFDDEME